MNLANPQEHVLEVECNNQITNKRNQASYHWLLFDQLTKTMMKILVIDSAKTLDFFPTKYRILKHYCFAQSSPNFQEEEKYWPEGFWTRNFNEMEFPLISTPEKKSGREVTTSWLLTVFDLSFAYIHTILNKRMPARSKRQQKKGKQERHLMNLIFIT